MWGYILTGAIGVVVGHIIEIGWLKVRGHRILVPYVSARSRNVTVAAILFAVISLVTVVQVDRSSQRSAECNRQFRDALAHNAGVSDEQRALAERITEITQERWTEQDKLFTRLGKNSTRPDEILRMINEYNGVVGGLSAEYSALLAERDQKDQSRKPYPEPECGR